MRFQFASTDRALKEKETPAVCAAAVPTLPLELPGAGDSPASSTCSLLNAPGFTVAVGLVDAVLVASSKSVAVSLLEPAVLNVTENVLVPEARSFEAGKAAFVSVEVICTVKLGPLAFVTTFQFVSTPLTVTLNAVPAVRAVGDPVLPVDVPGAAVSPGIRRSSFTNVPATSVSVPKLLPFEPSAEVVMPLAANVPPPAVGR